MMHPYSATSGAPQSGGAVVSRALPALAAAKAGLDWWRERNRPIGILLKPWRAHKAREKGLR